MIEISNSKYEKRIEEYFEELQGFLNDPYDDEDDEISFVIPKLAAHLYALQLITLNKDFVELVSDKQTQYFEIKENSARMHFIQLELINLINGGASEAKILNEIQDFDEHTKKFSLEQIEGIVKNFFYGDNGKVAFQRREWIKQVRSLAKYCKWLHIRKSKIINGELLDEQIVKIDPLDFNLNQTDLVHFFDLLVDADVIKEPNDEAHKTKGGFYGKLAKYFTARGKVLNPKSAKVVKTNKELKGSSYSDSYYKMLRNLQKTIQKKLDS